MTLPQTSSCADGIYLLSPRVIKFGLCLIRFQTKCVLGKQRPKFGWHSDYNARKKNSCKYIGLVLIKVTMILFTFSFFKETQVLKTADK